MIADTHNHITYLRDMTLGVKQANIVNAKREKMEEEQEIQNARSDDDNKESERWATAIGGHALVETRLPDELDAAAHFTVTRIRGDAEIALNDDDDFKEGSTVSITGGIGQAFTKAADGDDQNHEKVIVFSNIEEAGELAWTEAALGSGIGDGSRINVAANGNVTITSDSGDVPDVLNVDLGNLLESGKSTRDFDQNATASGSLFGASGTFQCIGASGCTITNDDGDFTVTEGSLVFDPDAGDVSDLKAKYADRDDSYAIFGYWMETASKADGKHDIETFAYPVGTTATFTEVEGTAKYEGGAAGLFVKRVGDISDLDTYDGEFTAKASLTATFGTIDTGDGVGTIAVANAWSVHGDITDFKHSGGDVDISHWKLTLEKLNLGTRTINTGVVDSPEASGTGNTEGDSSAAEGKWSVGFAGDAGTTGTNRNQPTDAFGEFNGHFVDGSVVGAFGATRSKE